MEGKNINKNEFYNKFSVRETRNSSTCKKCNRELPAGSRVFEVKDNGKRYCSMKEFLKGE